MNTNSATSTTRQKWLWPVIAGAVLLVWTVYCEASWMFYPPHLRAVPAFFLGALVLLALNFAARLWAGAWRNGRRWLVGREARRVLGWTVLFTVSVVALFYAVELWRGKRAWAAVVREAKARGESLDYQTLLVPPPPDQQNFAKAPLFAPFFEPIHAPAREPASAQLDDLKRFETWRWTAGAPFAPWLEGRETDLLQCHEFHFGTNRHKFLAAKTNRSDSRDKADAAAVMLNALKPYDAIIEPLRPFSIRPICWFPLEQPLPWMDTPPSRVMNKLLRLVRLRASAELAVKQPEAAFADLKLILRLADYGRQRPQPTSVVFHDHHYAVLDALQPLWEGLAQRCWTANQIAEFQGQLERLNLLDDYPDAVRADALTMATFVDRLIPAEKPKLSRELFDKVEKQRVLDLVRLFYPVGWSLQDQAALHQFHLKTTSRYLDPAARRLVGKWPDTSQSGLFTSSDPSFYVFLIPRVKEMCQMASECFPFAQTALDLATLACALERYRLANGEFPTALDALVPKFMSKLPHDVITGESLKYHRTDGGGFVLYSVGLNTTDDGGKPCIRESHEPGSRRYLDLQYNDWVWMCPATSPTK